MKWKSSYKKIFFITFIIGILSSIINILRSRHPRPGAIVLKIKKRFFENLPNDFLKIQFAPYKHRTGDVHVRLKCWYVNSSGSTGNSFIVSRDNEGDKPEHTPSNVIWLHQLALCKAQIDDIYHNPHNPPNPKDYFVLFPVYDTYDTYEIYINTSLISTAQRLNPSPPA